MFPAAALTPFSPAHVVGRDETCDTVLAGTEVSRRHAEFRIDGPVVAVRDLDSRNGVFVNGKRCKNTLLRVGDVVRCGEWIGIVLGEQARPSDFREISAGWYGGAALSTAVAPTRSIAPDLPIIIQGETGTGKEGAARGIHTWSRRAGPFVAVNCAALPGELAEAELFGYRKGAFTGAAAASPGLFRAADGGSIFLDEVLDLPVALQPKLLRVLEERRVRALGEIRDVSIDVRVIAATQESLTVAVANRRFRADLYARLDGLTVVLPPLRSRREDIVPLFARFLRQHATRPPPALEAKLVEALCLYDWPLNVRELLLLVRRLVSVHGHESVLKKAHLPERMIAARTGAGDGDGGGEGDVEAHGGDKVPPRSKRPYRNTDDEAEFESLIDALRSHGGSVAKAAAATGMERGRAYRLLSAHPDYSLEKARRQ